MEREPSLTGPPVIVTPPRPSGPPLPANAKETEIVKEADGKTPYSVCISGHVDVGKSTILGHLLHKLGHVEQKTMHKLKKESEENNKASFQYAYVLDTYASERQRGVTMDVATHYFDTPSKHVTILDCPGHQDLVPKVICGAAQADGALFVVNSNLNEFLAAFERSNQAKEHILCLRAMCVTQIIVAMNKMDTCQNQEMYTSICETLMPFFKSAGFRKDDVMFVPIIGLTGENLVERSTALPPWALGGPSLLEAIDIFFKPVARYVNYPLRIPISDVFKPATGGVMLAGRIDCGRIAVGDKICLMPSAEEYTVKTLTRREMDTKSAVAGDNVEVSLQGVTEVLGLCPGMVACSPGQCVVRTGRVLELQVVMLTAATKAITMSSKLMVHIHCTIFQGTVERVSAILDRKTGAVTKERPKCLRKEETGLLVIRMENAVVCGEVAGDGVKNGLSRVVLRDGGVTIAVGVIKAFL